MFFETRVISYKFSFLIIHSIYSNETNKVRYSAFGNIAYARNKIFFSNFRSDMKNATETCQHSNHDPANKFPRFYIKEAKKANIKSYKISPEFRYIRPFLGKNLPGPHTKGEIVYLLFVGKQYLRMIRSFYLFECQQILLRGM